MATFGQKATVPMPERCRCSHGKSRHMLAGFDGECVAPGCRCRVFRPIDPPAEKTLESSTTTGEAP